MQMVTTSDPARDDLEPWAAFIDQFTPMSKRLVITKPVVQEIAEGRDIIIPDSAKRVSKEFGLEAVVIKMADDVDPVVEVGDTVLIPEFAGVPIVVGIEVPFWMVGEGDILAVLRR